MIGIAVNVDSKGALTAIENLAAPVKQQVMESIGVLLVAKTKDNIKARTGPSGAWPSGPWSQLFGGPRTWMDISRSMTSKVLPLAVPTVMIGASHIAASVRQFGTIGAGGVLPDIVPVKKKALTIPISEAASKASYRGIDARTAFPDAFILKPSHGASALSLGVIARKVGGRTNKKTGVKSGQKLELLYLLSKRVAVRPHPFLPIDKNNKIAPESLANEVNELVINNFMKGAA